MTDRPVHITLGEDEFRQLVGGSLVITRPVQLILSPGIAPKRMLAAIADVMEKGQRPPDPPQAREFLPVKRPRR
jgi:hypothetical protein